MIFLNKQKKQKLEECRYTYLLGVLALNEPTYPNLGVESRAVTVTKDEKNVIFYVKSLSFEPDPIIELDNELIEAKGTPLYIGFESRLNETIKPSGYSYTPDVYKRAEILEKYFKDKLIVFRPVINYEEAKNKVHKNLEILHLEEGIEWTDETQFLLVPRLEIDPAEFEKTLLEQKLINLPEYYYFLGMPQLIICREYIYGNFGTEWKHERTKKNAWLHTQPEIIRKLSLKDISDIEKKSVIVNNNLMFLDSVFANDIDKKIEKEGEKIKITLTSKNENVNSLKKSENNAYTNVIELEFLKELERSALSKNLCYEFSDLVNFHISVKTNPLTIISGMSGTGKTQLAEIYAKALGLSIEDNNLLILPISPSFTEPGDILGYLNTSTGLYMPSETGLVDFLLKAEKSEKMHVCIFDEMNLSQVEHWFAPFISLLELKNPDERYLVLYNDSANPHNKEKYKSRVKIGKNVKFIGTVNLDETTRDFSDRLLDRANVITLNKLSFKEIHTRLKDFELNIDSYKQAFNNDVFGLVKEYENWINKNEPRRVFTEKEFDFFDELHEIIQKYDAQKGVSHRIIERMSDYINNIPLDSNGQPLLSRREAFDIQIKQRLMTKIRGPIEQFEKLIGTLTNPDEELTNSELNNFFISEKAQQISDFKYTLKEIKRKARELYANGYAS